MKFKKKFLIILGCIFNSFYCVNELFEDIIIFFGYLRIVWKCDLNVEIRFFSFLVNFDLGMVYFEFNLRCKMEMDFCFGYFYNKNVDIRFLFDSN